MAIKKGFAKIGKQMDDMTQASKRQQYVITVIKDRLTKVTAMVEKLNCERDAQRIVQYSFTGML